MPLDQLATHLYLERYEDAIQLYREILARCPDQSDVSLRLAVALRERAVQLIQGVGEQAEERAKSPGEYLRQAERILQREAEDRPDDWHAQYHLGLVWYIRATLHRSGSAAVPDSNELIEAALGKLRHVHAQQGTTSFGDRHVALCLLALRKTHEAIAEIEAYHKSIQQAVDHPHRRSISGRYKEHDARWIKLQKTDLQELRSAMSEHEKVLRQSVEQLRSRDPASLSLKESKRITQVDRSLKALKRLIDWSPRWHKE